jgi:IclR family transcriptional regulator, KDG regulon repressor
MKVTNKKTSVLQSVQNGLRVLHLFTQENPVWGITEMANKLELTKSTVSRLVADILAEGFLQKEEKKYTLGFSLLSISGVITSHLEIDRESKDIVKKLVNDLGETAHIAVLEGKEITYVYKIECKNPVPLLSSIGRKNPVSCTSSGKILLASQKKEVIDQIMKEGLPQLGPNSITDPSLLKSQLLHIKESGYSICINELHENSVSIAAPVRDYTGDIVAALSVVGTKDRIDETKIHLFKETIIKAANEISIQLGYISSAAEKEGVET